MVKNIDDIADQEAMDLKSDGEKYREKYLDSRPVQQWPTHLDTTIVDILWDIQIADLSLTRGNFGRHCGKYYRQGLENLAGTGSDLPDALEEVSDKELGDIAFQLSEFENEIRNGDADFQNVPRAIEAVLDKLLTAEANQQFSLQFDETGGTGADLVAKLFDDQTLAAHAETVVDQFREQLSDGLLAAIDDPQMTTRLWKHQTKALERWHDAGRRGYANMATATGKTVLGLAAIASVYGALHPLDSEIDPDLSRSEDADVLVVAHNNLILEQWREEFDRHLDIPPERTHGSDDVKLEWGTVHFRVPNTLDADQVSTYDLVIFDEAHHYVTNSGWGELLEDVRGNVLALSGSLDNSDVRRRLEETLGTEVKEFTHTEARNAGVIPDFEWEVRYAPIESDLEEFAALTQRLEQAYNEFHTALETREFSQPDHRDLKTYAGLRSFAKTSEGRELASKHNTVADLTSAVRSRRVSRWNLSPSLDTIADIVGEYATKRTVVLLDSNRQVKRLTQWFEAEYGDNAVYSVTGDQVTAEQQSIIDDFDDGPSDGVLVGTGKLLGEGVDIPHAEVVVNMATGGVNSMLIQRIGRVLRNPDDKRDATFVNVVGILDREAARVPREDGLTLLENAARFREFGQKMDELPVFVSADEDLGDVVATEAVEGRSWIHELEEDDIYQSPDIDPETFQHVLKSVDRDYEAMFETWSHSEQAPTVIDDVPDQSTAPDKVTDQEQEEETAETEPSTELAQSQPDQQRVVNMEVDVPTDNVVGAKLYLDGPDDTRFEPTEWSIQAKSLGFAKLEINFIVPPAEYTFGIVTPHFAEEVTITVE